MYGHQLCVGSPDVWWLVVCSCVLFFALSGFEVPLVGASSLCSGVIMHVAHIWYQWRTHYVGRWHRAGQPMRRGLDNLMWVIKPAYQITV